MSNVVLMVEDKTEASPSKLSHQKEPLSSFITSSIGLFDTEKLLWSDGENAPIVPRSLDNYSGIVQLKRINDIPKINKFLEDVNVKMQLGQYLVITMETKNSRKERIINKYPGIVSKPYYLLDFILKRVFPKWKPTRQIYFKITKGRNRVLSISEGLARMISCGFEIKGYKRFGYRTYIIGKKVNDPSYDMEPTYGALIRLDRVGKGGRMIKVCKMRTMYPYSEYLQHYIYEKYNLEEGGKFKNDFRMTYWGRVLRKYWIDELPMFVNFIKGEMKLVGVRPLSRHYFELYPKDLRELRIQVKPGLVPPYYADMPEGMEEIQESERKYIESYLKKPIRTDIKYFLKAFNNILFKGARSK